MKILILCTGNSCRSQMAEGFLRKLLPEHEIFSAGTKPADCVNPLAVSVMKEINIDISYHTPKLVDNFINEPFDFVITVCDNAKQICPVFAGNVKKRLHIGFDDPAEATGHPDDVIKEYRKVRDEIVNDFTEFSMKYIGGSENE